MAVWLGFKFLKVPHIFSFALGTYFPYGIYFLKVCSQPYKWVYSLCKFTYIGLHNWPEFALYYYVPRENLSIGTILFTFEFRN